MLLTPLVSLRATGWLLTPLMSVTATSWLLTPPVSKSHTLVIDTAHAGKVQVYIQLCQQCSMQFVILKSQFCSVVLMDIGEIDKGGIYYLCL